MAMGLRDALALAVREVGGVSGVIAALGEVCNQAPYSADVILRLASLS